MNAPTVLQIISSLKTIGVIGAEDLNSQSPIIVKILDFYSTYPHYQELPASAIYFILKNTETKGPVRVYELENGAVWFMGEVFKRPALIAAVGLSYQSSESWNHTIEHSKFIEEICA